MISTMQGLTEIYFLFPFFSRNKEQGTINGYCRSSSINNDFLLQRQIDGRCQFPLIPLAANSIFGPFHQIKSNQIKSNRNNSISAASHAQSFNFTFSINVTVFYQFRKLNASPRREINEGHGQLGQTN